MRTIVVLGFARLSVPEKIAHCRMIVESMTGNPVFPSPTPDLATVTAAIDACDTAYVAALAGGVDDTASMHAKAAFMEMQVRQLSYYVEGIANADPAEAEAVVLSAGMRVKNRAIRMARAFYARATGISGQIRLSTRFVQRATYLWQMCTDASLETWETIGQATRSTLVKAGLVPGHLYYFRVAVVDKNGQGPWSDVVSEMAH